MSKQPLKTPKTDALRSMREANYETAQKQRKAKKKKAKAK